MKQLPWWSQTVFYQVYLSSFADGNNDGIGDFIGLINKLDYIESLGVKGIWVTPFYPSPLVDNGYDISNYCDVDTRFGDLALFKEFVDNCHSRDIKVIIDLVINHVSDQHPWFQDALNNIDSPYRDYFIFTKKPNNWESLFSGSAWEKESDTDYFYYHKFAREQVDLNWQNPKVEKEIFNIIDFWIDYGVDGFRFDVINFLNTDGVGLDNPVDEQGKQQHLYDIDQPGVADTIARISKHIRDQGDDYFLIGEVGSEKVDQLRMYQSELHLNVVFNFNLGSQASFDVDNLFNALKEMEDKQSALPTLFFSSHDMPRMISRFGENTRDTERAIAVLALQLTAKGVPFIFNGEEIGMTDFIPESLAQLSDIQGENSYHTALAEGQNEQQALQIAIKATRDNSRSPMQWSNTENAGFSMHKPWMSINKNYLQVNVEQQVEDQNSILSTYKNLISIRNNQPALCYGEYEFLEKTDQIIHFKRVYNKQQIEVIINFGKSAINPLFSNTGNVLFGSNNALIEKNNILIIKSSL